MYMYFPLAGAGETGRESEEISRDNFLIAINVSFFQVTQNNSSFCKIQLLCKYLLSTGYFASAIWDTLIARHSGSINGSTFTSLECKELVHRIFYLSPLCLFSSGK